MYGSRRHKNKQIVQQLQSQLQESTPAASLHPSSPTDKKDLPDNIEILDRNDNTDFTKIPATKSDQKKSVKKISNLILNGHPV